MTIRIPVTFTVNDGGATAAVEKLGGATQRAGRQAESAGLSFGRLVGYLGGAAAALSGLRAGVSSLNSIRALDNRLRLLAENDAGVTRIKDELFGIADGARASYQSVAELYARIGLSAEQLNQTETQLLTVTDLVTKAVALSGATSAEASAGLIQFAQGLASGTLRGDELRSVLEQLPALADVIARGLGVTRGELRRLGEQGALTGEDVVNAILSQNARIEADYATFVPTIAQGWEVLTNGALRFVDSADSAFGASNLLARSFEFLGKNFDTVGRASILLIGGIAALHTRIALARLATINFSLALRAIPGVAVFAGLLASWEEVANASERARSPITGALEDIGDEADSAAEKLAQMKTATLQARLEFLRLNEAVLIDNFAAPARVLANRDEQGLIGDELTQRQQAQFGDIEAQAFADTGGDGAVLAKLIELQQRADRARIRSISNRYDRAAALAQANYQNEVESIRNALGASQNADNLILIHAGVRDAKLTSIAANRAAAEQRLRDQHIADEISGRQQLAAARFALARGEAATIEDDYQGRRDLALIERNAAYADAYEITANLSMQNALRLAAYQKYKQDLRTIDEEAKAAALEREQQATDDFLAEQRRRRDAEFELRGLRARLSPDQADDLALRRDEQIAGIDDAQADGIRTPEEAEQLRALVWEQYRQELAEIQQETEIVGQSLFNALFAPLTQSAPELKKVSAELDKAFSDLTGGEVTLAGIAQGFRDVARQAIASGDSVSDALRKMGAAVAARIAVAASEFAAVAALELLAQAFGAPRGLVLTAYYGNIADAVGLLGGGGNAPALTGGASNPGQRSVYHTGGIVGEEIPILAQRGEGVFTRRQMAALAPVGSTTPTTPTVNMIVNISNDTDRDLDFSAEQSANDDGTLVLSIVANDIANGGQVARSLQSKYDLNKRTP